MWNISTILQETVSRVLTFLSPTPYIDFIPSCIYSDYDLTFKFIFTLNHDSDSKP